MSKQVSEIVLDGKRYISAKRAADISGYANDYIGQLCRSGKIESTRIGRNWYVGELSILGHKHSTQQEFDEKEVSIKKIEKTQTYPENKGNSASSIRNSLAIYSNDDGILMPNLYRDDSERSNIVPINVKKTEKNTEIDQKEDDIFTEVKKIEQKYRHKPINSNEFFGKMMISVMVVAIIFIGMFTLKNERAVATLESTYSGVFKKSSGMQQTGVFQDETVHPLGLVARMVNDKVDKAISSFFNKP